MNYIVFLILGLLCSFAVIYKLIIKYNNIYNIVLKCYEEQRKIVEDIDVLTEEIIALKAFQLEIDDYLSGNSNREDNFSVVNKKRKPN